MASMLMFATPTGLRDFCADLDCCARLLPVETKKKSLPRERDLLLTIGLCGAHGRRRHFTARAWPARAV